MIVARRVYSKLSGNVYLKIAPCLMVKVASQYKFEVPFTVKGAMNMAKMNLLVVAGI